MKKQLQKGFTLIELIIVIIILGILAVTAAPRFLDLSTDARVSTLQGVVGAVRASSQIAHAALLVRNVVPAAGGNPEVPITIEGVVVETGALAAPNDYAFAEDICDLVGLTSVGGAADAIGTEDDVGDTLDCAISADGETLTISDTAATTPASCAVTYEESQGADLPPVINIVTTGC